VAGVKTEADETGVGEPQQRLDLGWGLNEAAAVVVEGRAQARLLPDGWGYGFGITTRSI